MPSPAESCGEAVEKLWVFFLVRITTSGYTLPWNSTDTSLSWVVVVAASDLRRHTPKEVH